MTPRYRSYPSSRVGSTSYLVFIILYTFDCQKKCFFEKVVFCDFFDDFSKKIVWHFNIICELPRRIYYFLWKFQIKIAWKIIFWNNIFKKTKNVTVKHVYNMIYQIWSGSDPWARISRCKKKRWLFFKGNLRDFLHLNTFLRIFMKKLSRDPGFFGVFRNVANFEELYLRAQWIFFFQNSKRSWKVYV